MCDFLSKNYCYVMSNWLQKSIINLSGVGTVMQDKLHKMGLFTMQDLLLHLPYKYLDKTRIVPIGSLRVGDIVQVQGAIAQVKTVFAKRRMLLVKIADDSGSLTLRFFNFYASQQQGLIIGNIIRCFGEVRLGKFGVEFIHPEYQLNPAATNIVEDTLTPIYPVVKGISQKQIQSLIAQAVSQLNEQLHIPEILPDTVMSQYNLLPLKQALLMVHQPTPDIAHNLMASPENPAQQRLIFEELLAHVLLLKKIKLNKLADIIPSIPLSLSISNQQQLLQHIGFTLTNAQQSAVNEILQDLAKRQPMMRLLQGDVGSGKTVVAAMAALAAVTNGCQAAFMVPTEILAEQHYKNLQAWFAPLGYEVILLTGSLSRKNKDHLLSAINRGVVHIVIGTHALFQEKVIFAKLGLVVIDEQHRFGVEQRLSLLTKSATEYSAHQLVMSATPIPRTLAMAMYADLELSVLDELPAGRKPITTVVMSIDKRDTVIQRIDELLSIGQQAYWICPLIEGSESIQCRAAEDAYDYLQSALPNFNIALVHGKMKAVAKEQTITEFATANINLLVATTVVEVGMDIPNASIMIIENAERLGLSQLHQLRGRVGRGSLQSYCLLLYKAPLSINARKRLDILRNSNDGFEIAQHDVSIRGIGDFFGTKQTGMQNLRVANLARDHGLLKKIQPLAENLLLHSPQLAEQLIARWLQHKEQFAKA